LLPAIAASALSLPQHCFHPPIWLLRSRFDCPPARRYTAVASEMEKVSALKQRIDESKGKTLNEISRIVDDINAVRACVFRRCGHLKLLYCIVWVRGMITGTLVEQRQGQGSHTRFHAWLRAYPRIRAAPRAVVLVRDVACRCWGLHYTPTP